MGKNALHGCFFPFKCFTFRWVGARASHLSSYETRDSEQVNYFKNLLIFYIYMPSSSTWISNFLNNRLAFCSLSA